MTNVGSIFTDYIVIYVSLKYFIDSYFLRQMKMTKWYLIGILKRIIDLKIIDTEPFIFPTSKFHFVWTHQYLLKSVWMFSFTFDTYYSVHIQQTTQKIASFLNLSRNFPFFFSNALLVSLSLSLMSLWFHQFQLYWSLC